MNPYSSQFAQLDALAGTKSPVPGAPMRSRAQEIRAMAKPVSSNTPSLTSVGNDVGQELGNNMSQEEMGGIKQGIDGVKGGADIISRGVEEQNNAKNPVDFLKGGAKVVGGALDAGAQSVIGAGRAIFAPITAAVKTAINRASDNPELQKLAQTPAVKSWLDSADASAATLEKLAEEHPTIAKIVGDVVGVGGLLVGGGEAEPALQGSVKAAATDIGSTALDAGKSALDSVGNSASKAIDAVPSIGDVKSKIVTPGPNNLEKIHEMIAPKPTVKEAKAALDQGRLFKGDKKGGLLTEGRPDKVAASPEQAKSVFTIDRLIPDAHEMDEATLYHTIDEKIGQTAEALKPEMQKVTIKPETVDNITEEWKKAKAEQSSNAYTPSDVNLKKLQADFESRLQKSKNGTMQDLWETRQAYDNDVPTNVKQANAQSSESLQAKKDIWLQNRSILTNAINDSENGLGETSRTAFSDMRDLYEAKRGIMSKAKIETTAAPSKVKQFLDSKAGKAAKIVGGVVVGDKIIKSATGIGF